MSESMCVCVSPASTGSGCSGGSYRSRDALKASYPPIVIRFNEAFAISAVTMGVLHI